MSIPPTMLRCVTILLTSMTACGSGGSDNWSSVVPPQGLTNGFADIWVVSEKDVWLTNYSPTIFRFDGDTFTTTTAPAAVSCLFALSPTNIWLCAGEDVLHFDGAQFTSIGTPGGVGALADLWVSPAETVYAVGDNGIVGRYVEGAWQTENTGSPFNVSVWGSADDNVYVMGRLALNRWDGVTWTEVSLPGSGAGDGQVWGTGPSNIWFLPGSSTLLHFDGTTWSEVEMADNMIGDLSAVWGVAANDLWAVGSAGAVAHYNGSHWIQTQHQSIGAPYLRQLTGIHGLQGSEVTMFAIGHQIGDDGVTPILYRLKK